uniref:Uncharacterized protein n=1 Tax=Terrapene triunguis TaxID=2587831 RepID=A0A674J5D7_9SAUR
MRHNNKHFHTPGKNNHFFQISVWLCWGKVTSPTSHLLPFYTITSSHFPKTPEERAAAAKKYNMRVEDYEDYEPHPDDDIGYVGLPHLRQNWREPMHWHFDMFLWTRVDTSPTVVHWHTMCHHFFLFIGFVLFMFWLGEMYPSYIPMGLKPSCLGGEK